ncbi:hypothetical protein EV201_1278 [Ancylomarina subtilis]|uniref:Uncharacterized protein n=1 Tax=Ancylomarina subtilis TaxID=1639035 RepID=A0A4Q7VKL8_9BACT|nr:hypothetical protein [Ancylomarina subtilis]RZT96637.1 hypothetical protein EV201_1278 [Ancylomarina subtilis]
MTLIKKFNKETNQKELFDDVLKKWYNPITENWVQRLRKPRNTKGEAKGKALTKIEQDNYTIYKFANIIFSTDKIEDERISIFITKLIRKYYSKVRMDENEFIDFDIQENEIEEQKKLIKKQSFVHIKSEELKALLGSNYNTTLDLLTQKGYVERKKTSFIIKNGFKVSTMIYKPSKALLSNRYTMKPVIYSKVYKTVKTSFENKCKEFEGTYLENFKSSISFKFNIDLKSYNEIIEQNYNRYFKEKLEEIEQKQAENLAKFEKTYKNNLKYKKSGKETKSFAKYQKFSDRYFALLEAKPLTIEELKEEYLQYYFAMKSWDMSNYYDKIDFFKVDEFSGRLHSIFTNIPSIFIDYKWSNQTDITSCQMSYLAQLCYNEIGTNDYTTKFNELDDIYNHYKGDKSRTLFKTNMLASVFGQTNGKNHQLFCTTFPQAGEFITEYKQNYSYTNRKGKKLDKVFSSLCCELQQNELETFQKLWSFLYSQNIPFVSKHDSVVLKSQKHLNIAVEKLNELLSEDLKNVNYKLH